MVVNDRKQVSQTSHIDETSAFESAGNVEGWLVVSPATRVATGGQLVVTTSTTNNYTGNVPVVLIKLPDIDFEQFTIYSSQILGGC